MKSSCLRLAFSLALAQPLCTLYAQNNPVQILGPNVLTCNQPCITLQVQLSPPFFPAGCFFSWTGSGMPFPVDIQNPQVCQPGTYTLVVTDIQTGNTATASTTVTAFTISPYASIHSYNPNSACFFNNNTPNTCERVCPGSTVDYIIDAVGTLNDILVNWNVIGAEKFTVGSNTRKITITWKKQGVASITATVIDPFNGCSVTVTKCIDIVPEPKPVIQTIPAAVAADTLEVCQGQAVWFSSAQSQHAETVEWFFSDDQLRTAATDLEHYFQKPGVYEVILIARSICVCVDTTRIPVRVRNALAPQLACFGTVCQGVTVTYQVQPACPDMVWNVQNGAILGNSGDSLTVQWHNGPAGILQLSGIDCAGNHCPGPVQYRIPVIDDEAQITGPATVCPGSVSSYRIEAFGGANYVWTLTGGSGIIKNKPEPDQVEIQWVDANFSNPNFLVVEYDNCYLGCKGRDTLAIFIQSPFVISGQVERCAGSTGFFTSRKISNNQAVACNWTLYDPVGDPVWTSPSVSASVSIPFGQLPGLYRIVALPADPTQVCTGRTEWQVRVAPPPLAPTGIAGDTLICPGTVLTYETLHPAPGAVVRWAVQNGPGIPVLEKGRAVNVQWNTTGPRTLAAWQVSADGLNCTSDTVLLAVQQIAQISLQGPPTVCKGEVATYTTTVPGKWDYQWAVEPADAGVIADGQGGSTVKVFWQIPGEHQLHLSICGNSGSLPVSVKPTPEPAVTHPDGLCPGATAQVQTTAPFAAYKWTTAAGALVGSAATLDVGPGRFALTVTDGYGCTGITAFHIQEYPLPNISISTSDPTGFCNNSRFVTISALVAGSGDYSFEWFKDGSPLNVSTPTYTTNQYGKYSARVTNTFGCTATDGNILIFEHCDGVCHNPDPPPLCPAGAIGLNIVPTAACDSFGFQLVPGPDYAPGTASWRFGKSGGQSLGQVLGDSVTFRFPNAGHYLAILFAQLQNGAICAVIDSVRVEAVAQFSVDPACPGDTTVFKDLSTYLPGSGIIGWQWSFGDPPSGANNNSSLREPEHVYPAGADYPVGLVVTANSGCNSAAAAPALIPPDPLNAVLNLNPGCANTAVPLSTNPQTGIATYRWDFGDPASGKTNTTEGVQVYHQYSTPGAYTVSLTSISLFGCTASQTGPLDLEPNTMNGSITPFNPPAICPGANLTLNAPGGGATYRWSDNTANASTTVNMTGAYSVTLTDTHGCTYAPEPVQVQVAEAPAAIIKAFLANKLGQVTDAIYSSLSVCYGEDVRLQAAGAGNYTYKWPGNLTGSSVLFSTDHGNALAIGAHTFIVTVTDPSSGCTAVTAPFVVQVNELPAAFKIQADNACTSGNPVTLSMTTPGQVDYHYAWNTGDATQVLTTVNPGNYFLQATNPYGCSATSNNLYIRPAPAVAAVPAGCHTRCRPDTLCVPAVPGVSGWQWYKDGAAIAGATSPGFVATESGTYWARLTGIYGCSAESGPLTLQLYDGYGHILGKVWADANHSGAIDAGDSLLTGIPVLLERGAGLIGQTQSNAGGIFAFANVLSTDYLVRIDPANLPPGWEIVVGAAPVALTGCDAQAEVALLLQQACLDVVTAALQLNVCPGGTAVYNGVSIPEGSSHSFLITSLQGCDSLVTVNVSALPASAGTLNVSVCPGAAYDYNGTAVSAGASKDFVLQNYLGCDSVLTVNVSALPVSVGVLNVSVCPGTAYDYNGTPVPAGTAQDFVLQNYLGCDSVLTVNVSALPVSAGTLNVSVCPGAAYDYNGTPIPAGTAQDFVLQNYLGCDSVLTVNVSALPVSAGTLNVSVCPGGAYDYNGTAVPAGKSQDFVLQNYLGCDSVLTVTVSTLPVSAGVLNVSVCPGVAYDYNGASVPVGTSQDFVLQNYLGCDSVLTVNVSALPVSAGTLNVSVCPGTAYDYNGTPVPAGKSQDFVLQNYLGCDSVLTVNVSALPVSAGMLNVSVCPGVAYDYNGTSVPVGTSQDFVLQNYLGCDSVLTVNVSALPVSAGVLNVDVCPGAAYDYNGTAVAAGASQDFVLQNYLGCDSVLTVNVSALPVSTGAVQALVCPGESFVYQGTPLQAGQGRVFTLQNASGCDSLVTVTVGTLPVSSETLEVFVCPNETYLYAGVTLYPGNTRVFHFTNWEGCDSIVVVRVSAHPTARFDLAMTPSCSATGTGSLTVKNPDGGLPPYRYSLDGTFFQDETLFDDLKPGNYTIWLEDSHACLFPRAVELPALLPLSLELEDARLPCDGSGVRLEPLLGGDLGGLGIRWSTGATAMAITVHEPGPVWVEAHNACDTLRRDIRVDWAGEDEDFSYAYLPNVFAPASNDPDNSNFRPHFAPELDIANYRFEIYDRWGNLMFRSHDPAEGWTGPFRQQDMEPAVYVWQLWADIGYCGGVRPVRKVGDVTIVR